MKSSRWNSFRRGPLTGTLFSRQIRTRAASPLPGLREGRARCRLGERFSGIDVAEALLDALLQDIYAAHEASASGTDEGSDVANRHAGGDRRSTADVITDRLLLRGRCLVRFTQGPSGGPVIVAEPILDFTDDTASD